LGFSSILGFRSIWVQVTLGFRSVLGFKQTLRSVSILGFGSVSGFRLTGVQVNFEVQENFGVSVSFGVLSVLGFGSVLGSCQFWGSGQFWVPVSFGVRVSFGFLSVLGLPQLPPRRRGFCVPQSRPRAGRRWPWGQSQIISGVMTFPASGCKHPSGPCAKRGARAQLCTDETHR
jgi:hypothetical protein